MILDKLLRANSTRLSRFHSLRGELAPTSDLLRLPAELLLRALDRRRPGPWMCRNAVTALEHLSPQYDSVLELGSGASTIWFCRAGKRVLSLEDDPIWGRRIQAEQGMSGTCELRVGDIATSFYDLRDGLNDFDLILVDHHESPGFTRMQALRELRDFPGIVVLDNSDRPEYADAPAILSQHRPIRFRGMLRQPLQTTETTIFTSTVRDVAPNGSAGT